MNPSSEYTPNQGLENLANSWLALLIAFPKLIGYLGIRVFVDKLNLCIYVSKKKVKPILFYHILTNFSFTSINIIAYIISKQFPRTLDDFATIVNSKEV